MTNVEARMTKWHLDSVMPRPEIASLVHPFRHSSFGFRDNFANDLENFHRVDLLFDKSFDVTSNDINKSAYVRAGDC